MSEWLCITLPATKVRLEQRWCFYIPLLTPDWRIPRPDPPPERGPLPEPWIRSEGFKPEMGRALRALASIHSLSALLPQAMGNAVRKVVTAEAGKLELPAELQVRFE